MKQRNHSTNFEKFWIMENRELIAFYRFRNNVKLLKNKNLKLICKCENQSINNDFINNDFKGNNRGMNSHALSQQKYVSSNFAIQNPCSLQFSSLTIPTLQRNSLVFCRWSPVSWITSPYSGCSTIVPLQFRTLKKCS